jgi:hypothetical protein
MECFMFKKIIFTGLFSVMSTASFAQSPTLLKQDNSSYVTTSTTYMGVSAGMPVSQGGAYSGDIFAGYGKKIGASQRFYLGGEVTAGADYFKKQPYLYDASTSYSLAASVIPGVMLTPTLMAYGRAGVKTSYYQGHIGYLAPVVGVGLQKEINKNWGVRGEYMLTSNFASKGQAALGVTYKLD